MKKQTYEIVYDKYGYYKGHYRYNKAVRFDLRDNEITEQRKFKTEKDLNEHISQNDCLVAMQFGHNCQCGNH